MLRRLSTPHAALIALLALAAVILVFYRQAAFTNLIFARGDTLLYFYPYWDYRAQTLLAGRLPLWNPYLFMGAPFLANSQSGVFYPLNWPLMFVAAPVAVKISIVVHVIIAAWGTFELARSTFRLGPYPAAFSASVFALGGYLTAQVEHVNQLQGLAWMPLALLFTHRLVSPPRSLRLSSSPLVLLSIILALQLAAGHTQTTFITLVACGLTAAYQLLVANAESPRATLWGFGLLALGIFFAFALTAIQLIPTIELSRLSLRGGGLPLNEAVSFSLNPLLVGRSLLPGYSRVIFSEFVAYTGVIPLLLIFIALHSLITDHELRITDLSSIRNLIATPPFLALLLAGLGLLFALGGYNPVYLLLARLPGFSFFRVPARWLAWWALGAALLAGFGLQSLTRTTGTTQTAEGVRVGRLGFVILLALTLFSANLTPPGELGPIGLPTLLDALLWVIPFVVVGLLIQGMPLTQRIAPTPATRLWGGLIPHAAVIASLFELFLAAYFLPPNHLTTPDAYSSVRPAMTQLLSARNGPAPPARFLSLSALEFDPGDLAELHSEWDPQLPPDSVYDAIVATKHKEVLSPNLPLTWKVPSVDGYDGGILPLRAYAEFARQFGEVPPNTDGRLQQFLKTIPSNELLNLTNTRWIITDKTGDAWADDVFYDLGLTAAATSASPLTIDRLPKFQATALGLVLGEDSQSGVAQITLDNGETITADISYERVVPTAALPTVRLRWDRLAAVKQIVILTPTVLTLRGASLIDERTDSFRSLTLGPYRLAHSGDVKIYENLNILPRAFLAQTPGSQPPARIGQAIIFKYEAEHVVVETDSEAPGYLILTDTYYPGWLATVDGQPAEILPAYGLLRAVALRAGTHTVEFRFDPPSLKLGAAISAASLLAVVALVLFSRLRGRWAR